ncbi:MAG: ArsR/SmtB family transcription factor [Rhodospirillaceae bacterium]
MEPSNAISALSALAQDARLAIFRLLVEAGPNGLPVGDIAAALSIPATTLSFHLMQLKNAGLVTCRRMGRQLIHAANYGCMNDLIAYLSENCCGGNPSACLPNTVCKPVKRTARQKLKKTA